MSAAMPHALGTVPPEVVEWLRPADQVLDPLDMGGARATRHSFSRSVVRQMVADQWQVDRERFDVDDLGRGVAIYRVDGPHDSWRLVVFSQVLQESERQDRVIAGSWDVTLALVEGAVDEQRLAGLQANVPRQEGGRADNETIIWARGNRSTRFFNAVANSLAQGEQPDPAIFGASPYVMRSTAFYSNGKFGLADFERFDADHPFSVPYRPHFLSAWLMREFSLDLVEHCARAISPDAVPLDARWRRYLGLGNATGLGMVPYVINHPQVLDAWTHLRELPLASARASATRPDDPSVPRAEELFTRAVAYLKQGGDMDLGPFPTCTSVAAEVAEIGELLQEYADSGTMRGIDVMRPWDALHQEAAVIGPACRGMVASIITELTSDLDAFVEGGLSCDERSAVRPQATCGEVLAGLTEHYAWVSDFDFDDPNQQTYFWFSSVDNEEPRRGRRGVDPGDEVEHNTDIARAVSTLQSDLARVDPARSVARFLLDHPWHRGTIARVQAIGHLRYGEVHTNTLADDFLPLNVQRLQLAVYGMENFVPQSTDWLRVTLFCGAPRLADLAGGTADDDWIFPQVPGREEES